ncbi:MAG: RluA family pseudouridine synthase [Chitinivibrionales bacterium]|nr:RluA family pseudouridine synthase [Chitinivibrionales bacterium]
MIFSSQVDPRRSGLTLLAYLTDRFTYRSSSEWRAAIDEGQLRVNGASVYAQVVLKSGDTVMFMAPDIPEAPADCDYTVIYEDDWLMVIDKPANLLVHGRGKNIRSTLIYQVRYNRNPPKYNDATIINRLDRETSGIILLAKNKEACRKMHALIAGRAFTKIYTAIVYGNVAWDSLTVTEPIGQDVQSRISYKFRVDAGGKQCTTIMRKLRDAGKNSSVIECRPITGRTHQIRVHCRHIGHTIVGDKLYGMPEEEYLQWRDTPWESRPALPWQRQALHCSGVAFVHPFTNETVRFNAPLPRNFVEMEEKLKEGG